MLRRTVVSVLWFFSVLMAAEIVWSLAATPRVIGPILAIAAAVFMFVDPFRVFHPASADASGRAVGRPAALAPEGSLAAR